MIRPLRQFLALKIWRCSVLEFSELENLSFGFQRMRKDVEVYKQHFGLRELQEQVPGIEFHKFCKRS